MSKSAHGRDDGGLSAWSVVTRVVFGGLVLWLYVQTIERFGIANLWRYGRKKLSAAKNRKAIS